MAVRNMKYVSDKPEGGSVEEVHIDGLPGGGETPGNATTTTPGLVKKASSVAAVSSADATSTASGETVDPTEFAAVVALCNELKQKLNAALANAKSAGQMA